MKKITIGLLALVFGMAGAQAGYKSGSLPVKEKGKLTTTPSEGSDIVDRAAWKGGVVLADGSEIALQNAGGYFLPIELVASVEGIIWVSGAGLVPGRTVVLFTMHGGLINGKVKDEIVVGDDACLRFEYKNGTFGAQPIQATIFGNTATLLTVVAKSVESDAMKGDAHEER